MVKPTTLFKKNAHAQADYYLLEKSPLAWLATFMFRGKPTAMVIGKTIHLSGVTKETFLKDKSWLAHELVHIKQFQQYGFIPFLWLYLVESMRKGYYMNKFEVEARNHE